MKEEFQKRHEMLIDFLSQFSQYQSETGKPTLKKISSSRTSNKVDKISINEINLAVVVFTDVLNIYSGSAGDINLYKLLQAYLTVPEYREKINVAANEALTYAYNNKKIEL